ncbi:MAG: toxin TcdB middle/N-terminal domain-containing protein [Verrucomicrobiota bacterium]
MKNIKRFSVALMVLWTALENCPAQTGNSGASGGPNSASDQQVQAADLLGKRGQQKVDLFTGSFSYSIPIASAPARNGSEPNLALGYSSAEENGWCGMGWKLEIGSIERNTRDGIPIAYSTANPPAPLTQYDDSKGFMLNLLGKGYKLFSVATNSSIVEYRAEVDTEFLRCFLDTSNNKWTVYDKSGNVYYFGESAGSRMANPKTGWSSGYSGTFRWALDQIVTATGDWTTIAYNTYTNPATGQPERILYPAQITYNGHTSYNDYTASSTGSNTITFQTELRTNDWRISYRWGFRTEQCRRLTNIVCQVGSQKVWSYNLKYGISPATARSLLTNMVVYGFDAGNNASAFLTNTFAYQANTNGVSFGSAITWTNLILNTPGTSSGSYEPEVAQVNNQGGFSYTVADLVDMDGDGLPDRVNYDSSTSPCRYQVQKNLGNGFGSRYAFGPTSTGSGLTPSASNPFPDGSGYDQLNTPYGRIRDINGDGLPDRVMDYWAALNTVINNTLPYTPFTNYEVQVNTGQGFSGVTAWPVTTGPVATSDQNSAYYFCVESGAVNVGFFDINGDGMPDRVLSGWYTQGAMTNFLVQFNTGTNFTQPKAFGPYRSLNWNNYPGGQTSYNPPYYWAGIETPDSHMIDINGDGLPDHIMWPMNPTNGFAGQELPHPTSYFALEYNDGYSFESTNTSTAVPGAFDRWPGVVAQANNGLITYGTTIFYSDAIWDLPFAGLYDLNGDGLPDRVVLDQTSLNTSTTRWFVYLNNGHGFNTTPITLSNIENEGHYSLSTDAPWWSPQGSVDGYGNVTTLTDINGDGLLDRVLAVYFSTGTTPTANYFLVQLNNGPVPDLLTNINNGIGGNLSVTYKSSAACDNRVDPTNPNSVSHMPFPRQVTAAVAASDGINPLQTTTYGYGGGFFDGVRREFHGFAVVTNTDPTLRSTVTYFHTGGGRNYSALGEYQDTNSTTGAGNFPKAGMVYRVETYGNDNALYHVQVNQVDQASLGNGRYFPFMQTTFECDSSPGTTNRVRATQFAYDTATGNLTNKIVYGEVNGFNPTNVGGFSFTDASGADSKYYNTHYTAIGTYIVDHPDKATLTDGNNNVIRESDYAYNSPSGTLATKLTRISAGYFATNSYSSYNSYGLVGATTDPVGVQTTITYDSTYTYPATKTTGSFTTTTTYDTRSGALAVSKDPTGITVSNSFDAFCRPVETDKISVGGGTTTWLKKYSYPATLKPIVSGLATNYTDVINNDGVGGVESRTYLDGFGRPIQTRTQGENGNYRMIATAYDGRGKVILTTWPIFTNSISFSKPASSLTASWIGYAADGRMATNRAVSVTFDSNGAFGSKTDLTGDTGSPLAASTRRYANGSDPWWIVCTDEDGKVRRYGLDAFGRTNQIQEVDGANTYITTLKYDLANNLTNIVNNNLENIYYAFDNAGRMTAMADPYLGQWKYQRDYAGRLRVQTDARGDVIKLNYANSSGQQDPLGRLLSKEIYSLNYSNQTLVPVFTNICVYDNSDDGNFTVYPALLYKTTDSEGWEKNGYDSRGRLIKTVRYLNINGQSYTNAYTYNDGDHVTTIAYPNGGPVITNAYFTGGSLKQVSRVGGSAYYTVSAANIDEFGHVTNFSYGNGLTTTNSYYSVSKRLKTISAGSVFNRTYQYSAGDDVTFINGTGVTNVTVTYDNLHRIKTFTGTSGLPGSYGYDSVGTISNNIEGGGSSYGYGVRRPQAVKSAFGYTYLYDLCGNMIVRRGGATNSQSLAYDAENRLVRFAQAGTNFMLVKFGYAADDARLWKWNNQNPTNLQVWIGDNYEEKGGKILFHVFAGGQQVCTFEPGSALAVSGGDTNKVGYYYSQDNLNSSSALSDSSQSQVEMNVYYPFGRAQVTTPQAGFQVSHRFTGQVFDGETGLYYFNARYYDPELGRFIQPDTVIPDFSDPQSYNRYSYCRNNPLRMTDPTGHDENVVETVEVPPGVTFDWINNLPQDTTTTATTTPQNSSTPSLQPSTPNANRQAISPVQQSPAAIDALIMGSDLDPNSPFAQQVASQNASLISALLPLPGLKGLGAAKSEATLANDLAGAATRAGETVGPGRGAVYGTQVHSAFANEVRALGNPNVQSEVSFLNGKIVNYGTPGSVRLDVVHFAPNNQVLSAFDLKTGSATLTPQRILQIQQQVGSPIPVNLLKP